MVGENLIIRSYEINSNMKVTHKSGDLILAVDDIPILYDDEIFKIAIEASIYQRDSNFGSGIVLVTNLRVTFIGKAAIASIVSAIERATGSGKTFFVFTKKHIIDVRESGLSKKKCLLVVKGGKGLFGEKKEKLTIAPKKEYKEYTPLLIESIKYLMEE